MSSRLRLTRQARLLEAIEEAFGGCFLGRRPGKGEDGRGRSGNSAAVQSVFCASGRAKSSVMRRNVRA